MMKLLIGIYTISKLLNIILYNDVIRGFDVIVIICIFIYINKDLLFAEED